MPAAVEDREFHVLVRDRLREELRSVHACETDLEMWGARAAQRACPEECAAEVRAPAAAAGDETRRRPLERREPGGEDAGLVQDLQRVIGAWHV